MARLTLLVLFLGSAYAAAAAEARWLTDLETALARARKEAKPVFVVFRCEH
ncbi:MAG: hypothetical protein U0840_13270 [Gemmataceae bacterium]